MSVGSSSRPTTEPVRSAVGSGAIVVVVYVRWTSFAASAKTTADKDLAEEALGRHGDERVARGGGDVAAVDVTPFGSLGQVGFTRVGLEVERELALDRTHHRRGPRHTEGHVVRLQNLDRTHQADGEERGHETD